MIRNLAPQTVFKGSFPAQLPELGLPEVAFAGRSNVGKSSALNCLLNHKSLARVSKTPGRTQAINLFQIGDAAVFADLPGYGYAEVPGMLREAWKPMIEGYLGSRQDLALVVALIDVRREPQEMDGMLVWALVESSIPFVVVATKVDKLTKSEKGARLAKLRAEFRLAKEQLIGFSSESKEGRDALWDRIEGAITDHRAERAAEG